MEQCGQEYSTIQVKFQQLSPTKMKGHQNKAVFHLLADKTKDSSVLPDDDPFPHGLKLNKTKLHKPSTTSLFIEFIHQPWDTGEQVSKKAHKAYIIPSLNPADSDIIKPDKSSSMDDFFDSLAHEPYKHPSHAVGYSSNSDDPYHQDTLHCASMHEVPKHPDWYPPWKQGRTPISFKKPSI
jgi:hypothetical protein